MQGSQKTSNVESNSEGNAYWALFYPQLLANRNMWYPLHHLQVIGGF
jgi:hypothetical protein